MRTGRAASTVVVACGLALVSGYGRALATPAPADISVYGVRPPTFRDGTTAFPTSGGIFDYRQDAHRVSPPPDDPVTRLKFTEIAGLRNPLRRFLWRSASVGKYVAFGNGQTLSVGGGATDFQLGVLDSEAKTWCELVILPSYGDAIPQIVAGNPKARKSRVFFASGSDASGEPAFGYVQADLDSADPCTWLATAVSAADLNAGYPPGEQLCLGDICAFDSVTLLAHEDDPSDPYGIDYVMAAEYFSKTIGVLRIDSTGITVVDTYRVPPHSIEESDDVCTGNAPARRPSSDIHVTGRCPDSWQFVVSFDSYIADRYDAEPPEYCAAADPYCPWDGDCGGTGEPACSSEMPGAACDETCAEGYCALLDGECDIDDDCVLEVETPSGPVSIPTGPCVHACIARSSAFMCRNSAGGGSHLPCLRSQSAFCPSGETCRAAVETARPAQEYRFDRTAGTIVPISPMFGTVDVAVRGATPITDSYGTDGSVWVTIPGDAFASPQIAPKAGVYHQTAAYDCPASAEHAFYDPSNTNAAEVVTPTQALEFEHTWAFPYLPGAAQIGTRMYWADIGSLQYAQAFLGSWFPVDDTVFKVGFAYAGPGTSLSNPITASSLPVRRQQCSTSGLGCYVNGDCDLGETCVNVAESAADSGNLMTLERFLLTGGAPTSLWLTSGYGQSTPVAQTAMFVERVPVATDLPDNVATSRASVAWDGSRLWLVAQHGGSLQYRIRDDGIWSDWESLAPNTVTTPVGGAAVIANGSDVRIYARNASNRVHEKVLTSATSCAAGSCTWSDWTALPVRATADDVAATFAGNQVVVAVRGTDDLVYAIVGPSWGSWFLAGVMSTSAAPSVTYHVPDSRVWIGVRQKTTGLMTSARIDPTVPSTTAWASLPTSGIPTSWGTAPGLASDGTAVRFFAQDGTFPNAGWQSANDGSGWSAWRKLLSSNGSTQQPAATNINAEIELVTQWGGAGLQEAFLP